jgi:hypothetical protein
MDSKSFRSCVSWLAHGQGMSKVGVHEINTSNPVICRGNTIELSDPAVSRCHAELFLASDGYYIRDLGMG